METMDRLEAKLDAATSKVSEDLDIIIEEISDINEGRKKDTAELMNVKKTMAKIQKDTTENTSLHRDVSSKVTALDNRSNKNAERIKKMEDKINALENIQKELVKDNSTKDETNSPGCSFWTPSETRKKTSVFKQASKIPRKKSVSESEKEKSNERDENNRDENNSKGTNKRIKKRDDIFFNSRKKIDR